MNGPRRLRKLYEKYSIREIAAGCGKSEGYVRKRLERFRIPIRSKSEYYLHLHNGPEALDQIRRTIMNRFWLAREYQKKKRSAQDIADEVGVGCEFVTGMLRKFGLPIRDPSATQMLLHHTPETIAKLNDPKWLRSRYEQQRASLQEIAAECSSSPVTVKKRLIACGIPIRDRRAVWRARAGNIDPEMVRPGIDRSWLTARHAEGLPPAEIARRTGLPAKIVRSHLQRFGCLPKRSGAVVGGTREQLARILRTRTLKRTGMTEAEYELKRQELWQRFAPRGTLAGSTPSQ